MVNSIRLWIDNSIYTRNRGLCFCKQLMWNKQDNLCFDVKPICYKGLERGFLERNKLCKCGYIFILYFTGIGKHTRKKIILTDFREKDVLKYSMSWSCQIKAVVTKQTSWTPYSWKTHHCQYTVSLLRRVCFSDFLHYYKTNALFMYTCTTIIALLHMQRVSERNYVSKPSCSYWYEGT